MLLVKPPAQPDGLSRRAVTKPCQRTNRAVLPSILMPRRQRYAEGLMFGAAVSSRHSGPNSQLNLNRSTQATERGPARQGNPVMPPNGTKRLLQPCSGLVAIGATADIGWHWR